MTLLDVGDGNLVYWETWGDPQGRPALVVHGGPGSGCGTEPPRHFDLARYRVVRFDQRNCGRSRPHASDPDTDLRHNTTWHLVADMERLREHLGVDRWLLYGGSWGSTLILAYAQRHPERVSAIVIAGVTTTRRCEIDWLYRGVSRFFPQQWERFRSAVPDDDVVAGYARLVEDADPVVRARAVEDWCAWEDAVLSGETAARPYGDRAAPARTALVRICTRYFSHGAWLDDGALIRDAHRLAGIPGVLVHGRFDLASPPVTAWQLHRAWPGSQLILVDGSGHLGGAESRRHVREALDRLARRPA